MTPTSLKTIPVNDAPLTRRKLILHDSLTFLSLIALTVVLFAVTLLLFRSFMAHRDDLALRWAERGRAALQAKRPAEAIEAYRAALSYAPDDQNDVLMLARALGEAGRTDEAFNYFTELWDRHPGDGFINLQLARLAAKKRETQDAVNFYRASIYGTWEGDGTVRRREVRLELARFLIDRRQYGPARAELLVAGGNAPDTVEIDLTLARLLEDAKAPLDAIVFYRKALAREPRDAAALTAAGRISFAAGDYTGAVRLLDRAAREAPEDGTAALLAEARRILQLLPAETLPDAERTTRILLDRAIAKKRLAGCPDVAGGLQARWGSPEGTSSRAALLRDPAKQAAALRLAYDTETSTARPPCPPPAGDDALLLLLARSSAQEEASHR